MPKILVVDDEPSVRDVLGALLGYAGHEVISASDGAEALGVARERHPDLIITDILMPTMDGYEFIRQLRDDPAIAGTSVVFYSSSYHDLDAAALAKQCGVFQIIRKPSDSADILKAVSTALGREYVVPASPAVNFDQEHLKLVTDKLSDKVAVLETVSSRLRVLIDLSREGAQIRNAKLLADRFSRSARDLLIAKYAGVLLFDSQRAITYFTLAGAGADLTLADPPSALSGTLQRLVESAKPMTESDFGGEWRPRLFDGHPLVHSFLGTSIRGPDRCHGVIYAANKVGSSNFAEDEKELIVTLAAQLAVCCENVLLYDQLKERAELLDDYAGRLKILSGRLMAVREDEQRHIARELHDEIGQGLTALKIHLQNACHTDNAALRQTQIEESLKITESTLQQVRSLSLDLRPSILDDLGLIPALRWLLDCQSGVGKFATQLITDPSDIDVPVDARTTCFRVVQESLTNIVRHARAKKVSVRLLQNDEGLSLTIADDGIGFDVVEARRMAKACNSVGVLGMEERVDLTGGCFTIESTPGSGTTVRALFPKHGKRKS